MANEYFAKLPTEEIGSALLKKVDDFYLYLSRTGRNRLWERAYYYYYRAMDHLGDMYYTGEKDEFTNLPVNHFRNLLQHLVVMTTSQRPVYQPMAVNNDHKSQAQVILAKVLLEYYQKEKKIENHVKKAVETSLIYGDAYIAMEWDATSGIQYGVDDKGDVVHDGDIVIKNYNPLNVIFDYTIQDFNKRDWIILVEPVNRYELAAKFKKQKEQILGVGLEDQMERATTRLGWDRYDNDEMIPVYKFYHRPTMARPGGRYTEFITPSVVLVDTALPYKNIPVFRMAPGEQDESPFGYSVSFDLLPLQEAIDGMNSTAVTNIGQFGVQNILVPMGSNISQEELSGGLSILEYDPNLGPPSPLQLTATSGETYSFMQKLEALMETLSGVNSVTRGNPESSLKSGAALALVQSMAIQFNSGLQASYAQILEDTGTGMINILKTYATTPRIADIAGKSNEPYMQEWTKESIDQINRVVVDMGNPLSTSLAGRLNLAENLMAGGFIENPDQYIQVLETGRLEPVLEGKRRENVFIKGENEALRAGEKEVRALVTDRHQIHIMEHKTLLSDVDARKDRDLQVRVLKHIQEHITLLRTTDPGLLALLGEQPLPPLQAPGQPPAMGPEQPMPQPQAPVGGGEVEASEMIEAETPGEQEAKNVNLPNLPKNPLSGEEFNVISGGL
jgi:hypothetical protein